MKSLWIILSVLLSFAVWADERPNIIVILVDDMGYSDLGSFGGEVKTPHMDRLAKGGLRFTQNYNSARCCPSRATLLTGLYSHQAGIANFTSKDRSQKLGPAYLGKLNKECVTLAEVLKPAGYSTYAVGKWHVGDSEPPTTRGFDDFYGYIKGHSTSQWKKGNYIRLPKGKAMEIDHDEESYYATDAFSDYALEFMRQGRENKKPYFLYLAHSSPHFPLQAPAKTRDAYVETYLRGWDVLREERYARQKASGLITDSWTFTDRSEVPVDRPDIANGYDGKTNPAWTEVDKKRQVDLAYRMATFAAMMEHVDRGVGRIIEDLEKNGELENTLILFTSDNGACYEWGPYGFDVHSRKGLTTLHEGDALKQVGGRDTYHSVGSAWSNLSNTPLRMYKHFNHEGGNCSPMIAHWPRGIQNADRWVRSPIHLMDIMPTVLDISEAKYPFEWAGQKITPLEGQSLTSFFKGASSANERTLFFDHFESSAVRSGNWKLVRGNVRYNEKRWELYDISKDRCETKDLIKKHPEKAQELEAMWEEWALKMKISPYYVHQKNVQK